MDKDKLDIMFQQLETLSLKEKEVSQIYKLQGGSAMGIGLFNDGGIAVQHVTGDKGAICIDHCHNEKEIFIIYRGILEIIINGVKEIKTVGDVVEIERGAVHSAKNITEVELIAVTIPAEKTYPLDGRKQN